MGDKVVAAFFVGGEYFLVADGADDLAALDRIAGDGSRGCQLPACGFLAGAVLHCGLNIRFDDAAIGAGAVDLAEVEVVLFCDASGEGGGDDALAVAAG